MSFSPDELQDLMSPAEFPHEPTQLGCAPQSMG